jgi:crotonobetainyl-CoA:carnitine CoA-transferase CaiB-like acyl-CoA transferase
VRREGDGPSLGDEQTLIGHRGEKGVGFAAELIRCSANVIHRDGIDEIFADPQFAARDNLVRIDDERAGELTLPGVCPRLSETPGGIRWAGRALGADGEAILADWLD